MDIVTRRPGGTSDSITVLGRDLTIVYHDPMKVPYLMNGPHLRYPQLLPVPSG